MMATAGRLLISGLIAGGAFLGGCAAQPAPATTAQLAPSILVSSSPAAGATVSGPVDELRLRFDPPARLDQLIVSGPDGAMPTMIHAVGDVANYSIPLNDLDTGAYTVSWQATAQGRPHQGSFGFTVK